MLKICLHFFCKHLLRFASREDRGSRGELTAAVRSVSSCFARQSESQSQSLAAMLVSLSLIVENFKSLSS